MSFAARYTDRERDAIAVAKVERRLTAPQIVERAAAGELELDGERLPPFEASASSVGRIARRYQAAREGAQRTPLEDAEPRDAVEQLRVRLVRAVDFETKRIEKRQRRGERVPGEELRQLGRALHQLAAIGGPNDPRPAAPGDKVNGRREFGETRGGLAAQIEAAHLRAGEAQPVAPEPPPEPEPEPEPEPKPEPEIGSEEWKRRAGEQLAAKTIERFKAMQAATPPAPPPPVAPDQPRSS